MKTAIDRQKWARLGGLEQMLERAQREAQAASIQRREVVLVVHGTFANPGRDSTTYGRALEWWESSGSFTKALDAALERRGSKARSNTPLEWRIDTFRYEAPGSSWRGWSGDNSEVERRRGAYELAQHIRFLQRDPSVSHIHIVAHSHGGNVVRRALRYLNDPQASLGVVVCLGTPFLHFADTAAWRRWLAAVHWPMLVVFGALAGASGWVISRPGFNNVLLGYVLTAVAAAAGYSLWRYFRTSEGSSSTPPAVALRFANDEAIQLLRSCALLTSEPHLYLRDLLGGPARERDLITLHRPRRPLDGWFERLSAPFSFGWRVASNGVAIASNAWNGPVCRAAERLTTLAYRIPVVGAIAALLLICTMRPYRPRLRPFLSSRTPRLAALFFHSIGESADRTLETYSSAARSQRFLDQYGDDSRRDAWTKPWWSDPLKGVGLDPEAAQSAAAVVAASLYVVFYPIDKLLGLPSWLGAVMTRFAILTGVRAAASGAPGMDMLGAAFKPTLTSTVPAGSHEIVVPDAIEQDIEQRLSSSSRVDFTLLRGGIDAAKRASLAATVKHAFTDVRLLHAQYYQDARIVDYVAQIIAGTTPCEWIMESPTESGETTR